MAKMEIDDDKKPQKTETDPIKLKIQVWIDQGKELGGTIDNLITRLNSIFTSKIKVCLLGLNKLHRELKKRLDVIKKLGDQPLEEEDQSLNKSNRNSVRNVLKQLIEVNKISSLFCLGTIMNLDISEQHLYHGFHKILFDKRDSVILRHFISGHLYGFVRTMFDFVRRLL